RPRSPPFPYTTLFRSLAAPPAHQRREKNVFPAPSTRERLDPPAPTDHTTRGRPPSSSIRRKVPSLPTPQPTRCLPRASSSRMKGDRKSTRLNSSHDQN